jgi:hypothetical protein
MEKMKLRESLVAKLGVGKYKTKQDVAYGKLEDYTALQTAYKIM